MASKVVGNAFWQNIAGDSAHARNRSMSHLYGPLNWQENDFWQKVADDSLYTLWVKNFVEITLPCTISEINTFLHFKNTR